MGQPFLGQVRPARHADLAALAHIWTELMALHETSDERFSLADNAVGRWHALAEEMLDRRDGFLMVAEEAEQAAEPLGFCLGWVAQNPAIYRVRQVGFISEIAVRRTSQRGGVGRAMLSAVVEWFAERELAEFQLSTAVWNEGARAFWRAMRGEELLVRYRFDLPKAAAAIRG